MPISNRKSTVGSTVGDRRAQRREQILAAAWDVAAEKGLGAVSLHEVARRVGLKQPSLYVYVDSKLALFDAMFAQAYEVLLERIDALPGTGDARTQLLRFSREVAEFSVEDVPRQQLLFLRTIPGFEPSEGSYALARKLLARASALLSACGVGTAAHAEAYTAVIAGLTAQQIANDPGGTRWTRHLEQLLELVLDHFDPPKDLP